MKIFNYKLDWSFGSFGADYHRGDVNPIEEMTITTDTDEDITTDTDEDITTG